MENYKPNSYKYKEELREAAKQEKIVNGPVKTKKKSEVKKFTDIIISEDASKVKEYVFMDVLVPAFKKLVHDIVTDGINMILYGESGGRKQSTPGSKVSYTSYSSVNNTAYRNSINRTTYNYDDIILSNRGEAEAVLAQMDEIIATYGFVKVADLYDLVGITGRYTDNNYGWTDLHTARVDRVRDGYLLKLPRALPID